MYFTSDGRFQNMFFYQATFNILKYKNTSTEYNISWELKEVFNSKLIGLNNNLLSIVKYFEKKGIKFNKYTINYKGKQLCNENCKFLHRV